MGGNFSRVVDGPIREKIVQIECKDCDRSTQKELPLESPSSKGMPCEDAYAAVTKCMSENNGQIAPCSRQWDEFKACHQAKQKLKEAV